MGLLSVGTTSFGVPTISAFRLIKFFAESADKYINVAIRDKKVVRSLLALELPLSLLVIASDTLGRGWWFDVIVECGDESGRGVWDVMLCSGSVFHVLNLL